MFDEFEAGEGAGVADEADHIDSVGEVVHLQEDPLLSIRDVVAEHLLTLHVDDADIEMAAADAAEGGVGAATGWVGREPEVEGRPRIAAQEVAAVVMESCTQRRTLARDFDGYYP